MGPASKGRWSGPMCAMPGSLLRAPLRAAEWLHLFLRSCRSTLCSLCFAAQVCKKSLNENHDLSPVPLGCETQVTGSVTQSFSCSGAAMHRGAKMSFCGGCCRRSGLSVASSCKSDAKRQSEVTKRHCGSIAQGQNNPKLRSDGRCDWVGECAATATATYLVLRALETSWPRYCNYQKHYDMCKNVPLAEAGYPAEERQKIRIFPCFPLPSPSHCRSPQLLRRLPRS